MKKIAVITGASSGMGKEFALQISKNFSSIDEIWLLARRENLLNDLVKEIHYYADDINVRLIPGDLCDEDTISLLKNLLNSKNIKIKMLVNCAGFGKLGAFENSDLKQQTDMIDVNIKALVKITYICLPYMAYNSRIINFASSAAFLPQPNFAIYAATKAFVLSFSRALSRELKKDYIYVTAVCPGPVNTDFFNIAEEAGQKAWYKNLVMAECDKVVTLALNDSIHKKEISVYGLPMKMFNLLCKEIPHKVLLDITNILNGEK